MSSKNYLNKPSIKVLSIDIYVQLFSKITGENMSFDPSELLELSPLGILVCDPTQRIEWCNSRFINEMKLNQQDIIGHLYASLPIEAINKQGNIVQLFNQSENTTKKFYYWQACLSKPTGSVVHYFALENSNHTQVLNIESTKLPKRSNWLEFLDYEVSRSRRYDNPLSLLKSHVIITKKPNYLSDENIHQVIKNTLMGELRWADMVGNTQHDSYLMVLPETPKEALIILKNKILDAITTQLAILSPDIESIVAFGSAHWQKHDDSKNMLNRAREDLVVYLEKLNSASID